MIGDSYFPKISTEEIKILEHVMEHYMTPKKKISTLIEIFYDAKSYETFEETVSPAYRTVYGNDY